MRKLKLDLDDLEVTTFDASADAKTKLGTVEAHVTAPVATGDGGYTCDGSPTCYQTCANTCQGTCLGGVCGSWPLTYCPQCYYGVD